MCTAQATGRSAELATPEGLVCVARDQDDPRSIYIEPELLANPHSATDCGGRRARLARANLAGYMSPALIPAGAPFGYSGAHQRERVLAIKVLVQEERTHPAVLTELRDRASHAKLRRGYRAFR